jgi:PAS domain S-box-containing protein
MKKEKNTSAAAELRRQAEARLRADRTEGTPAPTEAEVRRLLHELQVHQVELEMQNEELRESRAEVEAGLERYTELYDFAPIGYFTVDGGGTIREANLAGAALLGLERSRLIRRRLEVFIAAETRPVFRAFLDRVSGGVSSESCEVVLAAKGRPLRHLQLEGVRADRVDGRLFRIAALDISERKASEDALRKSREELKQLYQQGRNTREGECKRISHQIHEELGQNLTALKMDISWLKKRLADRSSLIGERLADMDRVLDSLLQTVRQISAELRPGALDTLGLAAAVEWYARDFERRSEIPCALSIEPDEIEADQDLATEVFRILQAALTNVARHARATWVKVTLRQKAGMLELQVTDDGIGMSEEQSPKPVSLGLLEIRDRVSTRGGTLSVLSPPGEGTSLRASIPTHAREGLT